MELKVEGGRLPLTLTALAGAAAGLLYVSPGARAYLGSFLMVVALDLLGGPDPPDRSDEQVRADLEKIAGAAEEISKKNGHF